MESTGILKILSGDRKLSITNPISSISIEETKETAINIIPKNLNTPTTIYSKSLPIKK